MPINATQITTRLADVDLGGMALVPGSIKPSPITFADSYGAVGNTVFSIGADTELLSNDVELFGDIDTVVPFNLTTASGDRGHDFSVLDRRLVRLGRPPVRNFQPPWRERQVGET